MKYLIPIFSFLIFVSHNPYMHSSDQPAALKYPDININVTGASSTSGTKHDAPLTVGLTSNTSTQTTVSQTSRHEITHSHNFNFHIREALHDLYSDAGKSAFSCTQYVAQNKLKTIAAMLCVGYAYLYYQLQKTNSLVKETTSWCNWKQTVTLQHLMATKNDELIPQLLQDIQKKYLFSSNNSSQAISFDFFIRELQIEKESLQQSQTIQYFIQRCYCARLFPFSFDHDTIVEKIARLEYIIDLFSTWQSHKVSN